VTRRAVLITGSLASGKTAVAQEIIAVAAKLGLRAAAIDLDWLGWAAGATMGLDELIARNLVAMAGNFEAAGIDHLVMARAMVDPDAVQTVVQALAGWDVTVMRLVAPRAVLELRIRARDTGSELQQHLSELDEITERVKAAAPGAHAIANQGRELGDVAREVMRMAGWIA
jgi:hypothetical protein